MKITILDQENNRVIVADVPKYLQDEDASSDEIAEAIFSALGISVNDCEYMIGEYEVGISLDVLNGGKGYGNNVRALDEYTGSSKEDVLEALKEAKE